MENNSREIFRPISGFEAYSVSNLGRVMRAQGGQGAQSGAILSPKKHRHGYLMVNLSVGNTPYAMTVARAVCLAFHGPPPSPKHHALHSDGNPKNDCPSNIRWGTASENMNDADIHGTLRRGENHQNAKLTDDKVREMRLDRKNGMIYDDLAAKYGVSRSNCWEAVNGNHWSHI